MSVTVRQLNGDSTFLLIFSPEVRPTESDLRSANGAYSVLIDPWIVGSSVTAAPWFAITSRVEPSAVRHLSELDDEPDVVICSQNKQDHTNKETLLQLRPEGKTIVVAEPAAAKVIKSWNHFDPYRVHTMVKYDHRVKFGNTLRLRVPPLSPYGDAGEVNIAFIPAKNYMTGLHNAFGITYQPPTRTKVFTAVSTVDLPSTNRIDGATSHFDILTDHPRTPLSPPLHSPHNFFAPHADNSSEETVTSDTSSQPSLSQTRGSGLSVISTSSSSRVRSRTIGHPQRNVTPHQDAPPSLPMKLPEFDFGNGFARPLDQTPTILTPPASPDAQLSARKTSFSLSPGYQTTSFTLSNKASSDLLSLSPIHPGRPKALSILYTPHGISLAELRPYIQNHLVRLPGALPLTAMLHSFGEADNPWYLGGNIMTGATGGVEIAKALMARSWISAHDGDKDDQGLAVKLLKTRKTATDEIRKQLHPDRNTKSQSWFCDLRSLEVGEDVTISNDTRDADMGSLKWGGSSSASVLSQRPSSSWAG